MGHWSNAWHRIMGDFSKWWWWSLESFPLWSIMSGRERRSTRSPDLMCGPSSPCLLRCAHNHNTWLGYWKKHGLQSNFSKVRTGRRCLASFMHVSFSYSVREKKRVYRSSRTAIVGADHLISNADIGISTQKSKKNNNSELQKINKKKKNPLSMLPLQYLGIWIYCICLLFVRAN